MSRYGRRSCWRCRTGTSCRASASPRTPWPTCTCAHAYDASRVRVRVEDKSQGGGVLGVELELLGDGRRNDPADLVGFLKSKELALS